MPYEVHAYSIDTLRKLLADKANADPAVIATKTHCFYFESYFGKLGAKTIVVENDYVDRDFLEDFAAYYVRCHHQYDRRCARLHFFNQQFAAADLENLLKGGAGGLTADLMKSTYLGFVVVKPLPETVVGRTCLRTYPEDHGRRCFPITRSYDASLFGIDLKVESLAFQEQDSVVAACATSALWSAFHGTGMLFQHAILSPVEITKAASVNFAGRSRNLPNRGLTAEQMALAVRSVGLEPFVISASDEFVLKSSLYGYLRGRVPTLLLGALFDTGGGTPAFRGQHAVAATGFGVGAAVMGAGGPNGFLSNSCFIDRIYAHDDQVGPFARMVFDGTTVTLPDNAGNPQQHLSLSTSWRDSAGGNVAVRFVPQMLLVPLYHKIRIPFGLVQSSVVNFDDFIELLRSHAIVPLKDRLKWDIHLTTVSHLKRDIFNGTGLPPDLRHEVLAKNLPRFIWRATARCDTAPVVDLLFDATDIEQGRYFVHSVKYDAPFASVLKAVLGMPAAAPILANLPPSARTILDQFK
ncbi:MAG TPA: hypothetical protein VHQ47_13300 [Phycisphaerae bacterium]|nr:hypothetical protein [Phycisphaerae bacterium]